MIEIGDKYQSYIDAFKKKFPNHIIGNVLDYDDNYILIEAVEDLKKPVGYDTWHAIDKNTKEIVNYVPSYELDLFFDALDNRRVDYSEV